VKIAHGWRESWVDFVLRGLRIALVVVDVMIDRSLNVASVTGPAMLLILKDLVQTPRS